MSYHLKGALTICFIVMHVLVEGAGEQPITLGMNGSEPDVLPQFVATAKKHVSVSQVI